MMNRTVERRAARWAHLALMVGVGIGVWGCSDLGPAGATCGGAQSAFARATLPDTGIGGGTELLAGLSQYDPYLIGEEAEISVQHLWPAARGKNPETDPRVRFVRDDGRVLLDTLASRFVPNSGDERSTWIVIRRIHDAELRNAIFEALRDQAMSIELWRRDAAQPGTRVRLRIETAGVSPVSHCL
jgi:hypothetical protein